MYRDIHHTSRVYIGNERVIKPNLINQNRKIRKIRKFKKIITMLYLYTNPIECESKTKSN